MGETEIKGIHPPLMITDEVQRLTIPEEVPLTLEDGTIIGTAKVQNTEHGLDIEATVNDAHAHIVRADPSPQFSLAGDGTGVVYVEGRSFFEKEVSELSKMMNVYDRLTALPDPAKSMIQAKEKTKRRAASKRARKARRNR